MRPNLLTISGKNIINSLFSIINWLIFIWLQINHNKIAFVQEENNNKNAILFRLLTILIKKRIEMKIRHNLFTIALLSLMITGCHGFKTESNKQTESAPTKTSQSTAEKEPPQDQEPAAVDDQEVDENIDESAEEVTTPSAALFTEDDAQWTITALETIQSKTARLFLTKPDSEDEVVLRYSDITVFGKDDQRILCGHLRPENSRMDNGKYFPFILEKGTSLNISARESKSAIFERKWQTNCTLKNGRAAPLSPDNTGILFNPE